MANEELTIAKEKARLTVIGNSYPDTLTDSGLGLDLSQIIFDILIDLDIPMPDIDLDDLDDIPIIPGLDIDTEIPTLEYPDPDWPDDEIPPIIDWPMPDLDWDDFIDKLEDLDLDPNILTDLSFVGLNDLGIPTLVSLDEDFNIQKDELPASIEIVTPPKKLEYQDGERIDLTGMVVTAKKADGSTWTSAKYPNGHIPLGELIVDPGVVSIDNSVSKAHANHFQYESFIGVHGSRYYYITYSPEPFVGFFYHVGNALYLIFAFKPGDYPGTFVNAIARVITPDGQESVYDLSNERGFSSSSFWTLPGIKYIPGANAKVELYGHLVSSTLPVIKTQYPLTEVENVARKLLNNESIDLESEIIISWARPQDGKQLSTSFEITAKSSGNGGGR